MKQQQSPASSTEDQSRASNTMQRQTAEQTPSQTNAPGPGALEAPHAPAARAPAKLLKLGKMKGQRALRSTWQWLEQPDIQLKLAWWLTVLLMLSYMVVTSLWSLYRYWTFEAQAYDLGNMDQAIWNTLHGRFFVFTNRGWDYYGPPTRLAIHVEPILLPLSLLYLIHSSPETLLIFQSVALGLGAIPVFLLARHWLPR